MNEGEAVQLNFLHNDKTEGFIPLEIRTCEGDIVLIINAILDYADILEAKAQGMESPFEAESARYYVGRFRKIAAKYSEAIGYNREEAIEKCQKRKARKPTDFGEEAMSLMVKFSNQQKGDHHGSNGKNHQ